MYSSNESHQLSDQITNSLPSHSRQNQRQKEPSIIVQRSKDSLSKNDSKYRGKSLKPQNFPKDSSANDVSSHHINNPSGRLVTSSENNRVNKIQKTAYDKKKNMQAFPVKVQNLNQMVQIRKKKPKMKFFEKQVHKAQQERQIYSQQVQHRNNPQRFQKILDGFLLLYSCRVKLPHEAIRSKLSGENIVDVREEDLVYFKQNLKYLDISDNQVYMEQLINLQNLEELDMQYNNLDHLELQPGVFPQLQVLHLSYNKIPVSHLQELQYLQRLRVLNVASNDFCTLPGDLSYLRALEEIDLSSNSFSTDSVLVNPSKLFETMASIPYLKKLNLSRNKFKAFHAEDLPKDNIQLDGSISQQQQQQQSQVFPHLVELNFAFNLVDSEESLLYCATQLPSLMYLIVTGNPFAIKGDPFETANLEQILNQKGGKLINETLQPPTYLRRQKSRRTGADGKPPLMLNYNFPQSREMVLISDKLKAPSLQFHQEKEDLFPMPPQEEQIQAIEYKQEQQDDTDEDQKNENKFFITENETLKAHKSRPSQQQQQNKKQTDSIIQEENYDPNRQKEYKKAFQEITHDPAFDEDYGHKKMEIFKQKCRDVLGQQDKKQNQSQINIYEQEFEEYNHQSQQDSQYVKARDYNNFLDIISAYKTLKQAVNKTSTVHNTQNKNGSKGYLKMTIAATQHSKSKMARDLLEYSLATKQERVIQTAGTATRALLPSQDLTGKNQNKQQNLFKRGPTWRKSKQEVIDEKVERLFESYKIYDDVSKKQQELKKGEDKKNKIKNKYFPKEDEDDYDDISSDDD